MYLSKQKKELMKIRLDESHTKSIEKKGADFMSVGWFTPIRGLFNRFFLTKTKNEKLNGLIKISCLDKLKGVSIKQKKPQFVASK